MGLKLFEGDNDDVEKLDKIEINEEFARRYEHNKKREDLQRLEELKKKGLIDDSDNEDSSEDDEEEEEEEDLNPSSNLKFIDVLLKIKKGDPILNNKDATLFVSESESESNSELKEKSKDEKKKKKNKPKYLKDVVFKHLIEGGPEFGDKKDDEEEEEKKVKTYFEEQEDLRKEFLNADKEDEDAEDLFKVKVNGKRGDELGDDEEVSTEFAKKLDEAFGEDDKFLKDYFGKEMWKDDKKRKREDVEEVEFSEDEEEIERQEDYERDFNFRFEENGGDRVWGHSRKVEGSVRKKANARKLQRERKEERMVQAEEERKEELKRLKNLKKKEMREKLEKIKETAGIGEDEVCLLDVADLEEEFDPNDHDRKMKKAFDDAYYEANDMDPEFGSDKDEYDAELEKPEFDKEDELLGYNVGEPRDDNDVAEEDKHKKKKKRKRTSKGTNTVKEHLMEEYYKLDYEDTIGELKTRFKYRPVKAKRFGLTPEEILTIEDKNLNQYVSLKKLAPYREKEWKLPLCKAHQAKKTLKGEISDVLEAEKKPKFDNKENFAGETDGTSKQSRRSRWRKKKAEYKLSAARLKAYSGNISESKRKKN
ncbi:uncharacterized protein [Nicotiana tomentosiformis]|uniref:uncharacterized protein n=1 Tax=Nicotiana tomentosiformis TaxID=4098 RepID=UPI00051B847C|nr:protein KRI1 homolog [Nicotiana tomentosiformis]XP_033513222.1 protein KRI1 homolog [Nicotiana tomentosiformis]